MEVDETSCYLDSADLNEVYLSGMRRGQVLRAACDQADTIVAIAIVHGAETLRGRRLEVWVCLANRTPASSPPESAASTRAPVPSINEGRPLHTTTAGGLLLLQTWIRANVCSCFCTMHLYLWQEIVA